MADGCCWTGLGGWSGVDRRGRCEREENVGMG